MKELYKITSSSLIKLQTHSVAVLLKSSSLSNIYCSILLMPCSFTIRFLEN